MSANEALKTTEPKDDSAKLAPVAPVVVKKLPPRRAAESEFQPAEYKRTAWYYTLKHGESRNDVLRLDFWAHVRAKIKINDHIEITHEEGNYFAEAIVLASDALGVKIAFLRELDLSELDSSQIESGDYYIKFRGRVKWSILRKEDHQVIEENISSEGMAKQRLRDLTGDLAV